MTPTHPRRILRARILRAASLLIVALSACCLSAASAWADDYSEWSELTAFNTNGVNVSRVPFCS